MQSEPQNVDQGVTGYLLQAKPVHQKSLCSGSSTSWNVQTRRACRFRRFLFKSIHGLWWGARLNWTVLHWSIKTWSLVRCRRQRGLPTSYLPSTKPYVWNISKGPRVVTLCPCKRALLWLSLQILEFISGYNPVIHPQIQGITMWCFSKPCLGPRVSWVQKLGLVYEYFSVLLGR